MNHEPLQRTPTPHTTRSAVVGISICLAVLNSACISTGNQVIGMPSTNPSSSPTPTAVPSGPKAVRIIFSNTDSGSFETNPTAGAVAAVRVFNPDDTLLSNDASSDSWPQWLPKIEIGITSGNCARFSNNTDTTPVCDFDNKPATPAVNCGVPENIYRVSEFDCTDTDVLFTDVGTGINSDPVFIRATLNRNTAYLGSGENIMAVLEYAASGINQAPEIPANCFTGGIFKPTAAKCSDFVWQSFLKHSLYEIPQPYLLLVPPMSGYIDAANNRGGGGTTSKQIILPLAGDSGLKYFQMSRVSTRPHGDFVSAKCVSNSAQCAGMVFYSLTFYRI